MIASNAGGKIWTSPAGKPESLGKFLEQYWYDVKTKPAQDSAMFIGMDGMPVYSTRDGIEYVLAADMTWRENQHPRAKSGQFGEGGGGSTKAKTVGETAASKAREHRRANGFIDHNGNIRSGGLSREHHIIEGAFHLDVVKNKVALTKRYFEEIAVGKNNNIVDPDLVKKLNPDFKNNPDLAGAVHEPSSALAKEIWTSALKEKAAKGDTSPTMFSAGGSGSGKGATLPMSKALVGASKDALTFDSVLGNLKSAERRINETLKETKGDVVIAYTNANIEQALTQNIGRERTVTIATLAHAHAGAAKTIKQLTDEYRHNPRVKIKVVNNLGGLDELHEGKLSDVPSYDAKELTEQLKATAKRWLAAGTLTQKKYDLLIG